MEKLSRIEECMIIQKHLTEKVRIVKSLGNEKKMKELIDLWYEYEVEIMLAQKSIRDDMVKRIVDDAINQINQSMKSRIVFQ